MKDVENFMCMNISCYENRQESPADARVIRATAVRVYRHLGFLKFESCTISSAVPENPTLEPSTTPIGKPVAKLWPFLYIQDGRQPPSWILSNRK